MGNFDVIATADSCKKPGIPKLLLPTMFLWATCAFVYFSFRDCDAQTCKIATIVFSIISLVAFILLIFLRIKKFLTIALSIFLGFSIGSLGAFQVEKGEEKITSDSEATYVFKLDEDATKGSFGASAKASLVGSNHDNIKVKINFSQNVDLLNSAIIKAVAKPSKVKDDQKEYLWSNGICATVTIKDFEVLKNPFLFSILFDIRKKAIETIKSYSANDSDLLLALVCGYRNQIKESGTYDKFKTCGLAHIVAVSGAHLSIVVMMMLTFLRFLKVRRTTSVVVSIIFVLFYLSFAGIPISAIRAAVMVVLSLLAGISGRRASPINALCLAIIAFLVLDPTSSTSVSLFLSAASTLGIMLFANLFSSWMTSKNKTFNSLVSEPLALTFSSSIATLPFSSSLFSQVSSISFLSNIIATPLFSIACTCGLLCVVFSLIFSPASSAFLFIANLTCLPLKKSVQLLSQIPYASIPISQNVFVALAISVAICATLWILWPKINFKKFFGCGLIAIALLGCFLIFFSKISDDEVVVLDVGQGDGILIRSQGRSVLVDTGNKTTNLKNELAKRGVFNLDCVVITHHDNDHMGCLKDLASFENVRDVYTAQDALSCICKNCEILKNDCEKSNLNLKPLKVGDEIKIGKFSGEVIWPDSFEDEGGNSDSVCLNLRGDYDDDGKEELSMLLTGDAESKPLEKVIDKKRAGDIDILKVGHHGSAVSLSDKVLESLKPEVAIFSVGKNNRYGHPRQQPLDLLNKYGVKTFRTDECGSVSISLKTEGYAIKTG